MKAEEFLKKNNADSVEDLNHKQLLAFAKTCMDDATATTIRLLETGILGFRPDPLPKETDKAIIEAYKTGKSVIASLGAGESSNGSVAKGSSGVHIFVVELKRMPNRKKEYLSPDGTLYESYEAYCNDPDLDTDLVQVKLYKGERTPQNQFERNLLREIEEARKNGKTLEIYPE